MNRVKASLTILGLLFTLIACTGQTTVSINIETPTPAAAGSATPTPWVEGTQAALGSPTPWVAGTQTALAALTAEAENQNALPTLPPPTIMEKPTDFSPVLYGGKVYDTTFFLLLGGVNRETWLVPDMSVARFSGEATYSLHSLTQEAKYFVWGKLPEFSPTCKVYSVGTDASLAEGGFVGVVDGWVVTKRPVMELPDEGQFYQQAVIDWLKEEGLSTPQVDSLRVYRVDIEGDGVDEVFISAAHLDESQHTALAGDYSIVLLRQVVGNDAVTKLVAGDIYRSQEPEMTFPRTYTLTNFIDLNQDGRLEVVVEIQKWEGFGARVFQIDGDDVIQTLGAEC
jgi:hypothetical protein